MNKKCLYCYQPLLLGETQEFHEACSMAMFEQVSIPFLAISLEEIEELAKNMLYQSMSLTGVQKKMSLGIENSPEMRFTMSHLNAPFILKPPTSQYPFLPEVEDLTMHLAQIFGISTAKHSLIRLKSGELAYITARFDRKNGEKYAMEDMCQLSGKLTEDKYQGSMEQVGKLIRKYATFPEIEVMKLYELTLFCFLTGNADMHLKNFSLFTQADSRIVLSPAYDLVATALLMPDDKEEFALTLNGKKRKVNATDFAEFAKRLQIEPSKIKKMNARFQEKMDSAIDFISYSFLPQEMQKSFANLVEETGKKMFI